MKRGYHNKYGFGNILDDTEGLCNDNEVVFEPDFGIFDKCDPSLNTSTSAFFTPAKVEIFEESEIKLV